MQRAGGITASCEVREGRGHSTTRLKRKAMRWGETHYTVIKRIVQITVSKAVLNCGALINFEYRAGIETVTVLVLVLVQARTVIT